MRQTYDEVKQDVDRALERLVKGTVREVIEYFPACVSRQPGKSKTHSLTAVATVCPALKAL